MSDPAPSRRPLTSRSAPWAIRLAARLAKAGVPPNAISLASIAFAAVTAVALLAHAGAAPGARAAWLLLAAATIQLRLVCNLLDGMVAIEGERKGKAGEVYNDAPDRLADSLALVAAGYAVAPALAWGRELGWLAALLAVATAYVRLLGGAAGLAQDFSGPMAKPHRMAVMTAACLAEALTPAVGLAPGRVLAAALVVVAAGSAITIARRLARIVRALEAR